MHKKYHKKFKILDILAVTTQAREGIETSPSAPHVEALLRNNSSPRGHWNPSHLVHALILVVTTQARESIETTKTSRGVRYHTRNNSSPWEHWNSSCIHYGLIWCLIRNNSSPWGHWNVRPQISMYWSSVTTQGGCGRFLGPELSNFKTAPILHRTQTP